MRALLTALLTLSVLLPFTTRVRLDVEPDELPRVEVLEAERDLIASVDSKDTETVEALLNDQVRVVDVDGALLDRTRALAAVRDAAGAIGVALRDPDLRFYDSVALVHGRSHRAESEMYVLRAWVRREGQWKLALEHATDITRHAAADPPAFDTLEAPVPARPTDDAPEAIEETDVRNALRESHRRYWAKDVDGYLRTVGVDLIRAAETGVRPGSELVAFMRDSPHLPRPPSQQLEMWAKVFGNVAIGGWLDAGTTAHGWVSRNRFTLALVWREGRWQIVQMQSTGVSGEPGRSALPAPSRQPQS
jgi:Domain of unknown function (DUF4440)